MIEIARITTFGCANNRDIIRRLMATPFYKFLTFAAAAAAFRYSERAGLVKRGDGYLVVYHDCD